MTDRPAQHFFGYGSLVNRATHGYEQAHPAQLSGWRRVWVHTPRRAIAFLSVRPDPGCTIDGLVAHVPGNDWSALDEREFAYARHPVSATVAGVALPAQVYAVPQQNAQAPQAAHPILLSYLDAVVQGFLQEFGADGAKAFFATTEGWNAPIMNDRSSPKYPRFQRLAPHETEIVDAALAALNAHIIHAPKAL
jgi:hypothetical protein